MNKVILSCLFSFLFFCSGEISGQINIKGNVLDQDRKPIPGSSIFVKDSYIGSISNRDGKFSIKIPQHLQSGKLCISCIGYQMQELAIDKIHSPIQISLQKDTCDLAEVLVMPKDTLLALLRRAYGKIKDNYPDFDTRMKGFYREAYYSSENNEYLYFGEAILDVFKTSYTKSLKGQVKIDKSRMNKHPLYQDYSSVMWYGGVHMPINYDDVKIRANYLSPNNFKNYDYSIYKDVLDGQAVYRINFKPKVNAKVSYQGEFYLDINSLAYLYCECEYSDYGFEKRNSELVLNALRVKQRKLITKYRNWKGKYFLSYISDEEKFYNKKTKSELIQFNEFLGTDIQIENVKPIPFPEQTEYRDVFYVTANDIKDSNWKEENIIIADSSLNKLIEYSPGKAQKILHKKHQLPKGYQFRKKMVQVITKMYFDLSFEFKSNDKINNASIQFSPTEYQIFDKSMSSSDPFYTFGMKMGYKLNPHWDVNFEMQESISKNFASLNSIGFAYETPLINRGNQLLLVAGMNYYFSNNGQHIGDFKSESDFKTGGKKIRADKVAFFVGKKKQGISFDLGLKTRIYQFYSLFITGGYRVDINDRDRLFIKEKSGFFLTRKTTDISLKDSSIQYFENGVQTTTTSFDTKDFYFKAGIRFAF
ncbi:carboxypeptidase-like regulatory domain-containing protein [Marinifilum sp. RC60d5]|uniref:carboxypeptidase-like regulatory domain-containing protein n=1 Tax=Marinifilum sp. RC60d5 TaxID=3458414 RepID=UPI004035D223